MDKKLIEDLFKKVSSHFDIVPEGAKKFFVMFVDETLVYRDELVAKGEKPLTVEEVQQALNLLENTLATKTLPDNTPQRITTLLTRWLVKLNEFSA